MGYHVPYASSTIILMKLQICAKLVIYFKQTALKYMENIAHFVVPAGAILAMMGTMST